MNPHILMVIDNQLNPAKYTKEQLKQNSVDADAAADAAAAYAYAAAVDYWLDRYFKQTGENKQDYIESNQQG